MLDKWCRAGGAIPEHGLNGGGSRVGSIGLVSGTRDAAEFQIGC